jgi:tryptophan halogenase
MFNDTVMLLGLNYKPEVSLLFLSKLDDTRALAAFARVQQKVQRLLETLPSHYEYLTHVRSLKTRPKWSMALSNSQPTLDDPHAARETGEI